MKSEDIAAMLREGLRRLFSGEKVEHFLVSVLEVLNDADEFRCMTLALLDAHKGSVPMESEEVLTLLELNTLLELRIEEVAKHLTGAVQ